VIGENGGDEVTGPSERAPLPGDFLLFHFGRSYSHGAIVINWPLCIHAHRDSGVVLVDALRHPRLLQRIAQRKVKVFTFGEAADVR
jgi:cell wall-associated NlpC family hydrolase